MAEPAQDRRLALRERLIVLAERRIADRGLASLRARDLAAEAGCALGAIYNVFGDLTELVLAVNARTFSRLGQIAAAAAAVESPADPVTQLIAMARGYNRFAGDNHNTWRALLDVARPADRPPPDWYLDDMNRLFALIDAPLARIAPRMPPEDRALLTRALFSAIHGIVLLSQDEASAGVPRDKADTMIERLLRGLLSGVRQ